MGHHKDVYLLKLGSWKIFPKVNNIQSNFNGSNNVGTMKISSRQG